MTPADRLQFDLFEQSSDTEAQASRRRHSQIGFESK